MSQTEPPVVDDEAVADAEEKDEKGERRCIVAGRSMAREKMVRFALSPDGMIVPDVDETLPGRGFWLSAERDVVNTACAKRLFAKAARARVDIPDGLDDLVEKLLTSRCLNILGLARRAGQATAGFEKVRARLRGGKAGLVLAASDGADDGRAKIAALAGDAPVVDVLTNAELAQALGRENAVHVVLDRGRLAEMLRAEALRLSGFRVSGP